MTINNFHNLDDDSLATLDNIVIMTINNVNGSLITRQGASFDDILSHSANAAFDLTSNVLPDRKRNNVNVSWYYISNVSTNHYIATSGGRSKK